MSKYQIGPDSKVIDTTAFCTAAIFKKLAEILFENCTNLDCLDCGYCTLFEYESNFIKPYEMQPFFCRICYEPHNWKIECSVWTATPQYWWICQKEKRWNLWSQNWSYPTATFPKVRCYKGTELYTTLQIILIGT